MDFVGYASNPKTFNRNQLLNPSVDGKHFGGVEGVDVPKFRSEQERERVFGSAGGGAAVAGTSRGRNSSKEPGVKSIFSQSVSCRHALAYSLPLPCSFPPSPRMTDYANTRSLGKKAHLYLQEEEAVATTT